MPYAEEDVLHMADSVTDCAFKTTMSDIVLTQPMASLTGEEEESDRAFTRLNECI